MKSNTRIRLTPALLRTLRGQTPRERLLHRLHCVVLVLRGFSASEVGRIYGNSARAVAYWVSRFHAEGEAGLEEEQRPGRPSKLDARQMKKLQTFVRRTNRDSKLANAATLASYIQTEFRVALTPRQCWRILKKLQT